MFNVARWYNNYQSPCVLMIDDLSDAYIDVYLESYKNDWGYLCNSKGSAYSFLKKELLSFFPYIKITFFVPYLKHNVINKNSRFKYEKFALGERSEYMSFLKKLDELGHEIAHHGSNHGKYIDESISSTLNNWIHEWALFDNVNDGVNITLNGVHKFKELCDINVVGGKYCGYIKIENSQEIIDQCNFLYWCEAANYTSNSFNEKFFGRNEILSFPTNFAGNAFVRLSYMTGNRKKDKKKKVLRYLQPLYNVLSYMKIYSLYRNGHIISIQQHMSPSTTSGYVQSANIITDILSLKKIFGFLSKFSIWYSTANEIARYVYTREKSKISIQNNLLIIDFKNSKNIDNTMLSLVNEKEFMLIKDNQVISSIQTNGLYVANVMVVDGQNRFKIKIGVK